MEFNPSKCQVIHISTSRNPIDTSYTLHGHVLEATSSTRYLGMDIANNLSWKPHINRITSSVSRSLGFLRRNIRVNHPQLKAMAYMAIVRPQLEYDSCVWNPHQSTYIDNIEKVQRRAARWVCSDYSPRIKCNINARRTGMENYRATTERCQVSDAVQNCSWAGCHSI